MQRPACLIEDKEGQVEPIVSSFYIGNGAKGIRYIAASYALESLATNHVLICWFWDNKPILGKYPRRCPCRLRYPTILFILL